VAHQNTGKLMKRVAGKTPIEDALQKLEDLTREEALVVAAKNLGIADIIYGKVDRIEEGARNMFDSSGMQR
jgi:hypothetical protein